MARLQPSTWVRAWRTQRGVSAQVLHFPVPSPGHLFGPTLEFAKIRAMDELKARVREALAYVADADLQQRLWSGQIPGQMGSFTEMICEIFDDTGLGDDLERGTMPFGEDADTLLRALRREMLKIDQTQHDLTIWKSGQMAKVRELAWRALGSIEQ